MLCAELESPDKAALVYRDFVRKAVRRDEIGNMAADAGIPEADRERVVAYIGKEFRGPHEGNAIRYRLRPEDLAGIDGD